MTRFLRFVSLVALAALAACASTVEESEWEPLASTRYVSEDGRFSLALPEGWLRSGQTITREGPEKQSISFNAGAVLPEDAAPIDAAARPYLLQALQDELAAQPGTRVLDVGDAQLDGLPGFRMHFVQASPGDEARGIAPGTERENLIYGAVEGNTLYALAYEAEVGAVFAHDLPAFEALVASFRRAPATP